MKKLKLIFLCFGTTMLFGCSGNNNSSSSAEKKENKTAVNKVVDKSPVGTYSTTENGMPMQFILNADKTGYENYQGTEKRPLTWKLKDGKIFFVYDGETPEWELPMDFDKNEIHYGALVYKKE